MWSPLTFNQEKAGENSCRLLLTVIAALIIFWVHSGFAAGNAELCAVDDLPQKVCLPKAAKRVISLAPSLTEIVFSLGAGSLLVGRSERCDYPPEALRIPVVGAYMKPDLEKIVSLNPDLVLVTKPGARKELASRFDALRIPLFVSDSQNIDDIFELVLNLGILLSREQEARTLVRDARAELDSLERSIAHSKHPTVLVAVGVRPLFVAGGRSYIGSLIRNAGGDNVAENASIPYLRYSKEAVLASDPDFILTLNKDCTNERECWDEWKEFSLLSAVRNRRVVTIDADTIARPSLRIVDAMKMLTQILHPHLRVGYEKNENR